jgi:microcystin-dependent protein
MDSFIGQIMMFAGNFAPNGWAFCNGQSMSIAQNAALFSLLGTTYGGDGVTTFMLPNLQGRVPVHFGNGPGLSPVAQGQSGGTQSATLTMNNLPAHSHLLNVNNGQATQSDPTGGFLAQPNNSPDSRTPAAPTLGFVPGGTGSNAQAAPTSISPVGNGQPFSTQPPYLAVNFVICLNGIYPSRS